MFTLFPLSWKRSFRSTGWLFCSRTGTVFHFNIWANVSVWPHLFILSGIRVCGGTIIIKARFRKPTTVNDIWITLWPCKSPFIHICALKGHLSELGFCCYVCSENTPNKSALQLVLYLRLILLWMYSSKMYR